MNIDFTNFWESNFYNHPALTEETVSIAERKLELKLPESLIKLLFVMNGGYTNPYAFPMDVPTSWAKNHIPLDSINGIILDKSVESPFDLLDLIEALAGEPDFPKGVIPFSGNAHTFICLDYRKNSTPTICWIDLEMDDDIYVADTFDEFIEGLVSQDVYEDDDEDDY